MKVFSASASKAQGVFSNNQPVYAAHGIPTFPVNDEKRELTRGYQRVGLAGSAELARKFPNAPALGFIAGKRSRITVLDIDTPDENVLSDALTRHGASNLVARTGSGKFHVYYRWGGERRRIRPGGNDIPIDILGGGVAIAPPSEVVKGKYKFIVGNPDDLDRLTQATWLTDQLLHRFYDKTGKRDVDTGRLQLKRDVGTGLVHDGQRNKTLWEHCMRNGKSCDDLNAMTDVALTFNENCIPPLDDDEVVKIAKSAWEYEERGMNLYGGHGVVFSTELYTELLDGNQDGLILLGFLRASNRPAAHFMCTNTLAEKFGWRVQRLAAARRSLIELGHLAQVKRASTIPEQNSEHGDA